MDNVRSEHPENVPDDGSGPERGEFHDAKTAEWQGRGIVGRGNHCARSRRPGTERLAIGAEGRCHAEGATTRAGGEGVGDLGLEKAAARVPHVPAAILELGEAGDGRAVADVCDWDPEEGSK